MMISVEKEADFIEVLNSLPYGKKLLFGKLRGNHVQPSYEIRFMGTAGGGQFGMAEINFLNQRGSGIYTRDPEEVFIRAVDIERRGGGDEWYLVDDVEHTLHTVY